MKILTLIFLVLTSICNSQIIDFPDSNFKNALLSHNPIIDLNGDGEIQVSEAEVVIQISISYQPITSLEGIQYFTSLEKLWYQQNFQNPVYITEIDLSNNINLKLLALGRNRLEFIDLSNNINLERLSLNGNLLTSIDLSNNINLKFLDLYNMNDGPGLGNLDLSANINLIEVGVGFSNLSFLNIQNCNNLNLEILNTAENPLLSCIQVDDENYIYPDCVFAGNHMDGWCIDSHTRLKEDCALNIQDENIQPIKIYPNPVYDVLNVNSNYGFKSAQIFNTMGRKVFSVENLNGREINIANLQSGIYFIELTDDHNISKIRKFIKK